MLGASTGIFLLCYSKNKWVESEVIIALAQLQQINRQTRFRRTALLKSSNIAPRWALKRKRHLQKQVRTSLNFTELHYHWKQNSSFQMDFSSSSFCMGSMLNLLEGLCWVPWRALTILNSIQPVKTMRDEIWCQPLAFGWRLGSWGQCEEKSTEAQYCGAQQWASFFQFVVTLISPVLHPGYMGASKELVRLRLWCAIWQADWCPTRGGSLWEA